MRWLIAAAAVVLTTANAFAQAPGTLPSSQIGRNAQRNVDQADAAKNAGQKKSDDKAYNAALHNLPNKEYDPWHGVR
jgi:hypothetical protein